MHLLDTLWAPRQKWPFQWSTKPPMFMLVFVSWGSIAASSVGQLWVSRDLWMPWRRQIMVTGSTQGTTNFRTTRPSWLTCFTLDMCSWISWISRLMQILDIHVYMFSLVFRLNLGQHYRHYIYINSPMRACIILYPHVLHISRAWMNGLKSLQPEPWLCPAAHRLHDEAAHRYSTKK